MKTCVVCTLHPLSMLTMLNLSLFSPGGLCGGLVQPARGWAQAASNHSAPGLCPAAGTLRWLWGGRPGRAACREHTVREIWQVLLIERHIAPLVPAINMNNRWVAKSWTSERKQTQLVLMEFSSQSGFSSVFLPPFSTVCLDDTFGHDCSLTCEDCSNGGLCNPERDGCDCPDGWTGIICNQSEFSVNNLFCQETGSQSITGLKSRLSCVYCTECSVMLQNVND